eukprot:scpid87278/ scgid3068/ Protein Wnt-5a
MSSVMPARRRLFACCLRLCCYLHVGLTQLQKEWCHKYTPFVPAIGMGANLALKECRKAFQYERWNCTMDDSSFQHVSSFQSKETAFVDAIVSAGVMMAISRTCSRGKLTKYCGCDKSVLDEETTEEEFEWGGCGDNFLKGQQYSQQFLDLAAKDLPAPSETTTETVAGTPQSSVVEEYHKWNNRRGRLAVADNLATVCKCHGLCGDCTVKICWKEVRSVQIGEVLKESYREAKQVRLAHPLSPALVPANVENNAIAASAPNPILTTNALVYVKESPDFCVANGTIGVAGTARRRCKENSKASDGCELLCCGNGYFETRAVKREQCECKFVWCCEVKCQWCHKVYRYFHCKMPRPQVA